MEVEMVTAILAGDRTLELRVFCTDAGAFGKEKALTRALCRQMDQSGHAWHRLVLICIFSPPQS